MTADNKLYKRFSRNFLFI